MLEDKLPQGEVRLSCTEMVGEGVGRFPLTSRTGLFSLNPVSAMSNLIYVSKD